MLHIYNSTVLHSGVSRVNVVTLPSNASIFPQNPYGKSTVATNEKKKREERA